MKEPSSDPDKPPGWPNKTPLWAMAFFAMAAVVGPSRWVWIAAILAIAAFCAAAVKVRRRVLDQVLNAVGTVALCGVFAVLGYCVGLNQGTAVFGKAENGVHYISTGARHGGSREIAVGKPLYWRMYWIEAITIVSFGVLIAGSAVFYPEGAEGKKKAAAD
jgi:hypothetical protein